MSIMRIEFVRDVPLVGQTTSHLHDNEIRMYWTLPALLRFKKSATTIARTATNSWNL